MKLRAIIVDDEPEGRWLLENRINKWLSDVEVIASCALPSEARKCIEELNPDLIFLDIVMPEMNGIEFSRLLKRLGINIPRIFVSAHEEVEFYREVLKEEDPIYLLKPFTEEELQQAFDKVRKKIPRKKIVFKSTTATCSFEEHEILYVQAWGKYSNLYTIAGKKETLMVGISKVAAVINSGTFFKMDRSTIVNMDYVSSASKQLKKVYFVDGVFTKSISVSAEGAAKVEELLRQRAMRS